MVALSDAWQKGAQGWDTARRTAFANDPLNLLAVDGPLNMQKGDGDAATWLPPNRSYRCAYVARQVAVKISYGVWMTQAEKNAIATVLSTCPNEPLPGGVVAQIPEKAAPAPAPEPAPTPVIVAPAPARQHPRLGRRPPLLLGPRPHRRPLRRPLQRPLRLPLPLRHPRSASPTRTATRSGQQAPPPSTQANPDTQASSTVTAMGSAARTRPTSSK